MIYINGNAFMMGYGMTKNIFYFLVYVFYLFQMNVSFNKSF